MDNNIGFTPHFLPGHSNQTSAFSPRQKTSLVPPYIKENIFSLINTQPSLEAMAPEIKAFSEDLLPDMQQLSQKVSECASHKLYRSTASLFHGIQTEEDKRLLCQEINRLLDDQKGNLVQQVEPFLKDKEADIKTYTLRSLSFFASKEMIPHLVIEEVIEVLQKLPQLQRIHFANAIRKCPSDILSISIFHHALASLLSEQAKSCPPHLIPLFFLTMLLLSPEQKTPQTILDLLVLFTAYKEPLIQASSKIVETYAKQLPPGKLTKKTVEALFIHLFQGNNSLPFLYGPLSLFPPSFTQIPRETRIAFLEKALPFLRTLPSFQERINKLEWLITQEDDVVF